MIEKNDETTDLSTHELKMDTLARSLVERFGADACVVIERQIDAFEGNAEAQPIWIELWQRACDPEARLS